MYELANRYYEEGDYIRAKRLYEIIAPKYAGRPQGERLSYFLLTLSSRPKRITYQAINLNDS